MANWVRGPVSAQLNAADQDLSDTALDPAHLVALEALVEQGEINRGSARKVLSEVMRSGTEPAQLMKDLGLSQIGDTDEISAEVDRVIAANPDEIRRYRAGEKKLFGFLLGQVMRGFSGRASRYAQCWDLGWTVYRACAAPRKIYIELVLHQRAWYDRRSAHR